MNGKLMLYLDQHGNPFWAKTVKELRGLFGNKKAEKMYADKKDGATKHIGYVIGGYWLTAYIPFEGAA